MRWCGAEGCMIYKMARIAQTSSLDTRGDDNAVGYTRTWGAESSMLKVVVVVMVMVVVMVSGLASLTCSRANAQKHLYDPNIRYPWVV